MVSTNLDSILKSGDITLPTKVHRVKAMIFPVIMYRCELDRKEGSPPKNWCFQIVVLEKSFENLLAARGSNKSILKTIYLEYSLEGLILKLKLQNFSYVKANSLEKTPVLGNIEGRRRRGYQRTRWLDGIIDSMDMCEQALGDGEGQGSLMCLENPRDGGILVGCRLWGCTESDTTAAT